jgi:hypothetical protein
MKLTSIFRVPCRKQYCYTGTSDLRVCVFNALKRLKAPLWTRCSVDNKHGARTTKPLLFLDYLSACRRLL